MVQGTAGNVAAIEPLGGGTVGSLWGDIFAAGDSAFLRYEYARIDGARIAAAGQSATGTAAPSIEILDTTMAGAYSVVAGVCPNIFDRVTITNANNVVAQPLTSLNREVPCQSSLLVREMAATGMTGVGFWIKQAPGASGLTFTFQDSAFTRVPNRAFNFLRGIQLGVVVERSSVEDVNRVFVSENETLTFSLVTLRDATVTNFAVITAGNNLAAIIERSTLSNGDFVFFGRMQARTMLDTRIEDVQTVFRLEYFFARTLTCDRLEIFNADVILSPLNAGPAAVTLRNSNFYNVGTAVVSNNTHLSSMDLTGNYWDGASNTTEVEALIDDTAAQQAGTDVLGVTDYSGWTATPNVLPDVPVP